MGTEGMGAAICPHAGVVIVPKFGIFAFHVLFSPRLNRRSQDKNDLVGFSWDEMTCIDTEIIADFRLSFQFEHARDGLVFVEFQAPPHERLRTRIIVRRLPRFWRMHKAKQNQRKLEVLGMVLHPRLGMNSLFTVDILFMVAKSIRPLMVILSRD
jgi:hypothetical protein